MFPKLFYAFDSLTLAADAAERQLERGLVDHIVKFLLELGAGFAFLSQMLYGFQAAQDVKLGSIGRTLDEPINMKKLEDRLSRNLDEIGRAHV